MNTQEPDLHIPRWAWIEIDISALQHNIRQIKKLIQPKCRIMAILKSNGYGHGAYQIAKAALSVGVNFFGVATVEEGLDLRQKGITNPILLLSQPPFSSIPLLLENNLTPTIITLDFAKELNLLSKEEVKYHLKIETGMNRIGLHYHEAVNFLKTISNLSNLKLEGIFTHFATADIPHNKETELQIERFNQAINSIRLEGIDPGIIHSANSAATILYPQSHFDMVRVGIILYGLHPSVSTKNKITLRPVMSVKAKIAFLKEPQSFEGVGYGFTHKVSPNSQIGTLSVGYADGFHRILSNKFEVLHKGRRVKQIGNICMDMMMIERTNGKLFSFGDDIVLVGKQNEEEITLDELAKLAGTINHELVCSLGLRLEKLYVNL